MDSKHNTNDKLSTMEKIKKAKNLMNDIDLLFIKIMNDMKELEKRL